jgi:hypothetical protein
MSTKIGTSTFTQHQQSTLLYLVLPKFYAHTFQIENFKKSLTGNNFSRGPRFTHKKVIIGEYSKEAVYKYRDFIRIKP